MRATFFPCFSALSLYFSCCFLQLCAPSFFTVTPPLVLTKTPKHFPGSLPHHARPSFSSIMRVLAQKSAQFFYLPPEIVFLDAALDVPGCISWFVDPGPNSHHSVLIKEPRVPLPFRLCFPCKQVTTSTILKIPRLLSGAVSLLNLIS